EGLGRGGDAPLDLGVTGQDVEAGDRGTAGRGRQEAAQHLDGGGLAGAVRAEESEDLPSLDLQRQLGHRVERSEAAAEPLREDDRSGVTPWGDGHAHWGRFPRASPWRRLFGSAIDAMAYRRSRRPTSPLFGSTLCWSARAGKRRFGFASAPNDSPRTSLAGAEAHPEETEADRHRHGAGREQDADRQRDGVEPA